jgi:hypothetical protein
MNGDEINEDMEMICALYWGWASQMKDNTVKLKKYDLNNSMGDIATEGEYNIVVEKISDGIPLIVSYDHDGFCHSINAIKILRDIEKPNVYYLECYDNNNKDEPYYFKIEQGDITFLNKTSFSNWSENYNISSYIKWDGEYHPVSLEFEEICK